MTLFDYTSCDCSLLDGCTVLLTSIGRFFLYADVTVHIDSTLRLAGLSVSGF